MDYSNRNIVVNELIGLKVKVIDSLDKKQKGISGLVIDETKNTLRVFDGKGIKSIVKKNSKFAFKVSKRRFVVRGEEINFRPYDRIEKSLKFYKMRE